MLCLKIATVLVHLYPKYLQYFSLLLAVICVQYLYAVEVKIICRFRKLCSLFGFERQCNVVWFLSGISIVQCFLNRCLDNWCMKFYIHAFNYFYSCVLQNQLVVVVQSQMYVVFFESNLLLIVPIFEKLKYFISGVLSVVDSFFECIFPLISIEFRTSFAL